MKILIATEARMHELGLAIGRVLIRGDLLSLNGPLGAGKTTLTRGIGEGFGALGNISSPTFLIAREHQSQQGVPFQHIDAYRLSDPRELDDLDIDFENSVSVVEWGRGFVDELSESFAIFDISPNFETEKREITIKASGDLADRLSFLEEFE